MIEPTRVAIVQRHLAPYRVPLFEHLRHQLAAVDVELMLLHGDAGPRDAVLGNTPSLPWAQHLPTHYLAGGRLCWQPFARAAADSQLIVIAQENKLLCNLPMLLDSGRRQRLAFWGHGTDLQARPQALAQRFKRRLVGRVDWWFAYTDLSARLVADTGYPPDRITVLHNTIDIQQLQHQVAQARHADKTRLRLGLGLPEGHAPLALMLGTLGADKRLPWLLKALKHVRQQMPEFQLVVAGAGPLAETLLATSAREPGLSFVGSVSGQHKATLLACADLMLYPGTVGLGLLDAFAAGLPVVATRWAVGRSPESEYLLAGDNAFISDDDPAAFAAACIEVLHDRALAQRLAGGAARSAQHQGIEPMARRFAIGIQQALQAAPLASARRRLP